MSTGTKNTELWEAAFYGHTDKIKPLLSSGANLEYEGAYGATALSIAVSENREVAVKELIALGSNVNAERNTTGATPISIASQNGFTSLIQILLEKKADLNKPRFDGTTPIFMAVQGGHHSTVKLLLSLNVNLTATRNDGFTLLHIGAQSSSPEIVWELLNTGKIPLNAVSKEGKTALFIACQEKKTTMAKLFLAFGADTEATTAEGFTALYDAAQNGNADVLKALVCAGSNLNITSGDDKTSALAKAAQGGYYDAIDTLVAFGANTAYKNVYGHSAADVGSASGYDDLYDYLSLEGEAMVAEQKKILTKFYPNKASEGSVEKIRAAVISDFKKELVEFKKAAPKSEKSSSSSSSSSSKSDSKSEKKPSSSHHSSSSGDKKSSHKSSSSSSSSSGGDKKSSHKSSSSSDKKSTKKTT